MNERMKLIGEFCRDFRKHILKKSLTEFCKQNHENLKNVSAFECGRANNIKYLMNYPADCPEEIMSQYFKGLYTIWTLK